MQHANDHMPRWMTARARTPRPCRSCGTRTLPEKAALPFCDSCLDWTRQRNLTVWDELGAGD
ncbi:MAG: hypothetical protein H6709_21230 [Kofleriaceae bacterium]|nr:hypothetical protein [Myxococcales bacterium]MCB9561671.1 hypothetical protein [Kofleriaceae bacterium]MCB9574607.1 hypothetical protein [Kofleriaceae bacterium]